MDDLQLKTKPMSTFFKILGQFIKAIQHVFPECTKTHKIALTFEIGVLLEADSETAADLKLKIINGWHAKISPFYEKMKNRDVSAIKEVSKIPMFEELDLWQKWNDESIKEGTHQTIWKYLDGLNKYCQLHFMYNTIPTGMVSSIEGVAKTIAADIQAGKPAPNFLELGRQVSETMKPEDLEQFAKSMMSNMGTMTSLCSSIMNEHSGTETSGDMGSMMKQFLQIMNKESS